MLFARNAIRLTPKKTNIQLKQPERKRDSNSIKEKIMDSIERKRLIEALVEDGALGLKGYLDEVKAKKPYLGRYKR